MIFQPTLFQYLSSAPGTRLLLGAQHFTILSGISLPQAMGNTIRVHLSYGHRKAGKHHMLFGFPVSTTAERRRVLA
jgi:hypothetical protein